MAKLSDIFKSNRTNVPTAGISFGQGNLFNGRIRQLPNDAGSYKSAVVPTKQDPYAYGGVLYKGTGIENKYGEYTPSENNPSGLGGNYAFPQPTPEIPSGDISTNTMNTGGDVTPDDLAYVTNMMHQGLTSGDVAQYGSSALIRDARGLNNARNDLVTGTTDPYNLGDGMQLSPDQLRAVRKATGGIYDPALQDLFKRIDEEKAIEKTTSAGGGTGGGIQGLLNITTDIPTQNMIKRIYSSDLGSTAEGKRVLELLRYDPGEAKRLYHSLVATNLTGTPKITFDTNNQVASSTGSISKALDALGGNNPYSNFWQQNGNYLLKSGNQDYQYAASLLGTIASQKIHDLYGGALTPGEEARANQFLPNMKKDSLATIRTKLNVLNAYAQMGRDRQIALYYGDPSPVLEDYLTPPSRNNSNSGGSSGGGGFAESW